MGHLFHSIEKSKQMKNGKKRRELQIIDLICAICIPLYCRLYEQKRKLLLLLYVLHTWKNLAELNDDEERRELFMAKFFLHSFFHNTSFV